MAAPVSNAAPRALSAAGRKSKRRLEPGGTTNRMLHRRPAADCPLCPLWGRAWDPDDSSTHGQQHVHAEKLWRAWNGGQGSSWPLDVINAAAELGVSCSREQAKAHFRHHRVEQPALSGQMNREALLYEAGLLSTRAKAVITSVYRQRLLTTEQIREVFYQEGRTDATARWMANVELNKLAARHFLYRLYPNERMAAKKDAPRHFGKQAVWLLGKASLPFIEETHGVKVWREHYVQMAKEVSDVKLMHDLRANAVYVRLHQAVRERANLLLMGADGLAAVNLKPANWYGDKALALAFYDRAHRVEDEIRADGFATLSVHRNTWQAAGHGMPSCQLPFFYEYDHGTKDAKDVGQQLLSYHLLARARKAAERFPDLDVPGYAVPVVMVFSNRAKMDAAQRAFLRLAESERLERGVPIVLVAEEDWETNPLADRICRLAWDEHGRRLGFLDLLLRASRPLVESRQTLATTTLRVDPRAARRNTGATSRDALADQREKQARKQRLAREQAQRDERLAQLKENSRARGLPPAST